MTLTARLIPSSFDRVPSRHPDRAVTFSVASDATADLDAMGVALGSDGAGAAAAGLNFGSLMRAGFEGKVGQSLVLPRDTGAVLVVIGVGSPDEQTAAGLRDAAAALARVARRHARIGFDLGNTFATSALEPTVIGQMIAEGVLLARYTYSELKTHTAAVDPLVSVLIIAAAGQVLAIEEGAHLGAVTARATNTARDLANSPPGHLTATALGQVALDLGRECGLEVEVFGKEQLIEMGCGGLLGVNAGSAEDPCMVKLVYSPTRPNRAEPASSIALVGKGIMYDAGGISLKPSDSMHLLMKMDMAGAAAVLAAMTALPALGCTTAVTGYLMCTDNMPSGTAMGLGDVLTIRGGTTVEIKNTDAEGRLVMADALVLATEEHPDAIIDMATLTGSALQALGPRVAAVFGNNSGLVEQARVASQHTDELIWQLPLEHRYREQLRSSYADISNMGGPFNVAITAALFLNEFVGSTPWVHFDIAGTMQSERDDSWRPIGATGFGTRLLIDMVRDFTPPRNTGAESHD